MTGILFGILKFLALILLGILGLILLVVLLVLLVPIRYEAKGSYHEQGAPQADACVSWLLHLIHIRAGFHDHLALWVRICGFKVFSTEEEKKKRKKKKKRRRRKRKKTASTPEPEKQETKTAETGPKEMNPEEMIPEKPDPEPENVTGPDHTQEAESADIPNMETEAEDNSEKRSFSFAEFYDKLKSILQRLPKSMYDRFVRICETIRGKYRMVSEKKQWIKAFLDNEDNRKTLRLLKRQCIRLIRHVFPRKLRGRIRFGFNDPYTTGQILTWISPFYGLYADKLELIPVFEEQTLEGELSMKGRVRIGTVIVIVVRVFLNRNFRKLLHELRSNDSY
jgi:hypothetical protein